PLFKAADHLVGGGLVLPVVHADGIAAFGGEPRGCGANAASAAGNQEYLRHDSPATEIDRLHHLQGAHTHACRSFPHRLTRTDSLAAEQKRAEQVPHSQGATERPSEWQSRPPARARITGCRCPVDSTFDRETVMRRSSVGLVLAVLGAAIVWTLERTA